MSRDLRILMLEDSATDAELTEYELRKAGIAFTSLRVETRDAFITGLDEFSPDIVLADFKLPAFDGKAALEIVQQHYPEVPVVMVTGVLTDIKAVDMIHAGAKDYVLKDGMARLGPAVLRALTEAQEVREHKAADQALRESEERFRSLVESTSDWIWETNEQAIYTYCSPQVHDLLGYTAEEIVGKTPFDLMTPDDAARIKAKFETVAREMKPFRLWENSCLHKDDRVICLETSGSPRFDANGVLKGYRGIDRDITERKRVEDELRRYKDQLEDTVHLRTAELLLARDEAQAANKAKSVFLANMSHELRTPLNAILGFSNILDRDQQLTESQRANLNIIKRSGEHLLRLINDVLEVAKIEAGRLQLEIAPFNMDDMVRDVTEMMTLRAQEKGLQLRVDRAAEFPRYIKGDEARLRQILTNLVGNAVKFTEQGGVTIRLRVKQNALLLEVEDSGPGISREDQKRLFEPFVQLTESAAQSGTGLGLFISRQFVQLMNGGIDVESTPGKGSLFRVELPVEPANAADILKPEAEKLGEVIGLAPGQPCYRILIAEDQYENRLLLSRLLIGIGLEVKAVENGEECVKLFQDWRPDLIWMDKRMPVMDGLEATRRIRQLPEGQTVKIVAVSASAFREQQQEMFDAGMDDFLRKPYRLAEIYETMARQLGIKYLYRSESLEEETVPLILTAEMLSELPTVLRQELKVALESLDSKRIAGALQQVNEIDIKLGRELSRLVADFNYPAIMNLLDQCGA